MHDYCALKHAESLRAPLACQGADITAKATYVFHMHSQQPPVGMEWMQSATGRKRKAPEPQVTLQIKLWRTMPCNSYVECLLSTGLPTCMAHAYPNLPSCSAAAAPLSHCYEQHGGGSTSPHNLHHFHPATKIKRKSLRRPSPT